MENELSIISELKNQNSAISWIDTSDTAGKALLFKVANNPDFRISDCIGQKIEMVNAFIEQVQMVNDETGEVNNGVRTVLIDKDGKGYQSVSTGIFNALKKLFAIYGTPDNWKEPVPVTFTCITRGKNRIFTLS